MNRVNAETSCVISKIRWSCHLPQRSWRLPWARSRRTDSPATAIATGRTTTTQIRNFFLAQLILPPAAIALPILLMFVNLGLKDTREGLILIYTVMNLPIVIWIMFDQFNSIPSELEQAAQVDGSSIWGAFLRIVLPIAAPGLVAAYILTVVLCWNEYFIALVLASTNAVTLPFLIAGQVSSQGIKWWTMAALTCAAIAPLAIIGIFLERYIVKGLTAGSVK